MSDVMCKQKKQIQHIGQYDEDGNFYHDTYTGAMMEFRDAWVKLARCIAKHAKADIQRAYRWMQKRCRQ